MANDDEIGRDPDLDRNDLSRDQEATETTQGRVSSLLNLRTLAAGMAGAVVAALILGAVVLFLRSDDNAPIQVLQAVPTQSASPADFAEEMKVYVTGAVVKPGVYSLPPGNRVSDAVDAAGGATADARLESINLALRVQDEGHYHIPKIGETASIDSTTGDANSGFQVGGTDSPGLCEGLIDINSAAAELLESLPNIGQVRAAAVVSYREANGGFKSLEDVTNVSGIGPATYEAIRELATACGSG